MTFTELQGFLKENNDAITQSPSIYKATLHYLKTNTPHMSLYNLSNAFLYPFSYFSEDLEIQNTAAHRQEQLIPQMNVEELYDALYTLEKLFEHPDVQDGLACKFMELFPDILVEDLEDNLLYFPINRDGLLARKYIKHIVQNPPLRWGMKFFPSLTFTVLKLLGDI